MLTRSLLLLVLFACPVLADPAPVADPIQFPPSPAPHVPLPGTAAKLVGKQVYPVTRVAPFVLRAYPAGVVSIRKVEIAAGETHHFEKEFSDGTTEKSFKGPLTVYFVAPTGKGNIDLVATPIGLKAEAEIVTKTLDVDAGHGPQPPPGPTPPTPDVPAPIPDAGLRVLVVYDALKLTTMTATQQGAIYGKDVRDYLRATCPKGDDGETPEVRMWPQDVDATGESKLWRDAFARPRKSVPWVIVSNGKTGFEGPLPGSATDMLKLLKQYGDAK